MLNGGYHIKKRILRVTSAAIAAVMLITGVPVPGPGIKPDIVMAAETGEGISSYTLNGSTFKGTLEDAFYKIYKGQDNFLSLNSDFTVASALTLPKDTKLEIKMNGHQISGSSTQFICVSSGAALRIIGNNGVIRSFGSTGRNGGAIYAGDNSRIELSSLELTGNIARDGGAICIGNQTELTLSGVRIWNNSASNDGGAICADGSLSMIKMDSATKIDFNRALGNGGAIYINGLNVQVLGGAPGTHIDRNVSLKNGGAVCVNETRDSARNAKMLLSDLIISGNSSQVNGGGIYLGSEGSAIVNTDVNNNSAVKAGGGICERGDKDRDRISNRYDNVTVTENKITGSGEKTGGGIYLAPRHVVLLSGTVLIKDNKDSANRDNNLFLDDNDEEKEHAYMEPMTLTSDSDIRFIRANSDFAKATEKQCNADVKYFTYDSDSYHVETDKDPASSTYQYLVIKKGSAAESMVSTGELDIDLWKTRTEDAGLTYTTEKHGSYPVYYGFATSPDHTKEDSDIVNKYYYSDGYFMNDPKTYDVHLATLGMNTAMASANSNALTHKDYRYKFDNIKSLFEGIGCKDEDIYINDWYIQKPTDDSIGVAIGKKTIRSNENGSEYTLVPIAIRSYGYESEWASNMTMNGNNTKGEENAESSGFRSARSHVVDALEFYIDHYNLRSQLRAGRVKFWLTGFSRGSATANLTGKYLVDTYGEYSKDEIYKKNPNEIFAYCYGVPAGGTDSAESDLAGSDNREGYKCIHNIINKADLTPMVAPQLMGFKRYGVDHYVPGSDAGAVQTKKTRATAENGGYDITLQYDNGAYYTNYDQYKAIRRSMLDQLTSVNKGIQFNDVFKIAKFSVFEPHFRAETDGPAVGQSIEQWLPDMYEKLQTWNLLAEDKKLTRNNYSEYKMREGVSHGNWYNNGTSPQDAFRGLVMLMLSKTPEEKDKIGKAFASIKTKLSAPGNIFNTRPSVLTIYRSLISSYGWKRQVDQEYWLNEFWWMLTDNSKGQASITDPGVMTQEEFNAFKSYYPSVLGLAFRALPTDYNTNGFHLISSFAFNSETILQGHVPEIYLAWLRRYDKYYDNEKDKAYKWVGGRETPAVVIPENLESGKEYSGEQTLKLKGDENSEIYYTITVSGQDGKSKISPLKLYNRGLGITLTPVDGKTTVYTVNTYALRGYMNNGKKAVGESSSTESYTFTINERKPEENPGTDQPLEPDKPAVSSNNIEYIDSVTIDTEYILKPETGYELENTVTGCEIIIEDKEYELNPECVSQKWTPDTGVARGNTEYTVTFEVDLDNMKVIDPDGNEEELKGEYLVEDDAAAFINVLLLEEDYEVKLIASGKDDEGLVHKLSFSKTFTATGKACVEAVFDPEPITIVRSGSTDRSYEKLIAPLLPQMVSVITDDGSLSVLPVSWQAPSEGEYDPAFTGFTSLELKGTVDIPAGFVAYDDDDKEVTSVSTAVTVNLTGGEKVKTVYADPDYDVIECDDDGTGQSKIRLYCETEGAVIYYTTDGSDPVDETGRPAEGSKKYENEITINGYVGDEIILKSVAVKEGMSASEPCVGVYSFIKPYPDIEDEDLDYLYGMELVKGEKLSDLYLPDGWAWDTELNDPAALPAEGLDEPGDMVEAVIKYNPDSSKYSDIYLVISVPVTEQEYYIETDAGYCMAYGLVARDDIPAGEEEYYDEYEEGLYIGKRIFTAPKDGRVVLFYEREDEDKHSFTGFSAKTASGKDIVLTNDKVNFDTLHTIEFTMPGEDVAVYPMYDKPDTLSVNSITPAKGSVSIKEGGTEEITVSIEYTPGSGDKPSPLVSGGNDIVEAALDEAAPGEGSYTLRIKGIKAGTATLWISCGDKLASVTVKVNQALSVRVTKGTVTKVNGNPVTPAGLVYVEEGDSVTIKADAPDPEYMIFDSWDISGAVTDDINKEELTFKVTGNVKAEAIYKKDSSYFDKKDRITPDIKVNKLTLSDGNNNKSIILDLGKNSKAGLIAEAVYGKEGEAEITFDSSNTGSVVVKRTGDAKTGTVKAEVIAVAPGTAEITAYCGNKAAKITVYVLSKATEAVILSDSSVTGSLSMKVGEQQALWADIYPINSTDQIHNIKWEVDKAGKKVISVSKGLVTAKAEGDAVITAVIKVKSDGEKKATVLPAVTCRVHVDKSEDDKPVKKTEDKNYKLGLDKTSVKLDFSTAPKGSITVKLTSPKKPVTIDDLAASVSIEASSTNENVVIVGKYSSKTEKGAKGSYAGTVIPIKAVGPGTAFIKIKSGYGENGGSNVCVCKVTVTAVATDIEITGDSGKLLDGTGNITMNRGETDRLYWKIAPGNTTDIGKLSFSATGGVTIKNGVIKAMKVTKPDKPAKVMIKCGKVRKVINITVK